MQREQIRDRALVPDGAYGQVGGALALAHPVPHLHGYRRGARSVPHAAQHVNL